MHVATWDAMIIIKSLSQGRNAIASQDGMVLHVMKILALQNHVKMQEYAMERSQNREIKWQVTLPNTDQADTSAVLRMLCGITCH